MQPTTMTSTEQCSGTARLHIILRVLFSTFILMCSAGAGAATELPIINGQPVDSTHQFPWQVALVLSPSDAYNSQFCGGILVDPSWILTAGHCDLDRTAYVVAGITDLTDTSNGQIRAIAKWYRHPDFSLAPIDNDIALIKLASPIDMDACGSRCETIDFVTPTVAPYVMPEGTTATVSGWGNRATGDAVDNPQVLEWADVQIMDCSTTSYDPSLITDNMICASSPDFSTDSCNGDSGGPLVVANNSGTGYLVAGIVSFGIGCAVSGYPGVYTKASNYFEWAHSLMRSRVRSELVAGSKPSTSSGGAVGFEFLLILLFARYVKREKRS